MELTNLLVPVGWRLSTVGDSCEIDNHLRAPISSDVRKDMRGEYPYYGPTGILDYIEQYRVEGKYALIAEDGDHFLKYENVDMTLFVSGKFNVNNHAHLVKGKGDCSTEWVYDFFRRANLYPFITRQGAGRYKLNKAALQELPILIPPLPEQRKIAEILRTWDEAIATVEQLIAALQRRKKGLMQRLLTGQVRFPEFECAEWEDVELGQFLSHTPRKVPKPSEPYKRMGIRSHGKGTFTEIVEDPGSNAMDHLYTVKGDDLIVNITFAWEQAIAIVSPDDEGSLVSHRFPTYEFNRSKVVPEFFRYLMLTKRFLYQLDLITPGGAGRNRVMSKTDFLKLQVTIPPVEEQKRIGAVLSMADKEINTFQEYLCCLKLQKKGLMQRLLTGQVRVQV